MSHIIVNPDDIKSFTSSLNRFQDNLSTSQFSIKSQLQELANSWQDEEHKVFQENFNSFLQSMNPFLKHIESYRSFLTRKANSIHRAINIKDETILDEISKVFNKNLENFLHSVENGKSKYTIFIKDIDTKILKLQSIDNQYSKDLEQDEYKVNRLNNLISSISAIAYDSQRALNQVPPSDVSKILKIKDTIADAISKQSYYSNQVLEVNTNIVSIKSKIGINEEKLTKVKLLQYNATTKLDEYNYLISYLKTESDNILNDTFKKIGALKKTLEDYKSIKSNSISSSHNNTTTKLSIKKEIKPLVKEEISENNIKKVIKVTVKDEDTILIKGKSYIVKNLIENNRVTSLIYYNNDCIFQNKYKVVPSKTLTILKLHYNEDFNIFDSIITYIESLALLNNISTIICWVDIKDIENFKNIKFLENGSFIKGSGIEMKKEIKVK